ncbi:MAG: porin [Acetobacteraceae bacterium]|nr:porin [Acetobacteraceae bacterium]
MRKILLASVATVAMTGVAAASGLEPTLGSSSSSIINKAEPGKAVVRLDGFVFFSAGFASNTVDKAPNGAKADGYGFLSTFRIYPAFDAQTPGGLRYGAFAEVRSNSNTGGTNGGVGTGGSRGTNTLYVNRAFGYLGTDQIGTIRFGSIDGPASMMRTGTFEGQIADGGWNGWAPGMTRGVNPYRFAVGGGYEYSTQKVTWMSPNWSGIQLGASFAPGSAPNTAGDGNNVAIGGNTRQATSTLAGDLGRTRNTFEVGGRYTGNFGGFGTQVHVGYIGSSSITNSNVGGVTPRGLSIVTAGATVSYMGFMVGGYMNTGTFNGNFTPANPGDKSSTVYTLGASYENGPWVVGAAYLNASFAGVSGNNVNRTDQGWTAGVTYKYAPGAYAFLEFVTGTAKERGVNLSNDVLPAGSTKAISSTAIILGNGFRW